MDTLVSPNEFELQTEFANSLSLTVDELNYEFDRDLYALDVFWDKVVHVLVLEYPQNENESRNEYMDRIKAIFYSEI